MGSVGKTTNKATSKTTKATGTGTAVASGYELSEPAAKNLREGNIYAFGTELLKAHPQFAEQQGFDLNKAVNRYRSYIEYNDGIFTFYGEDSNGVPTKYFFDEKMKFRGTKQ